MSRFTLVVATDEAAVVAEYGQTDQEMNGGQEEGDLPICQQEEGRGVNKWLK